MSPNPGLSTGLSRSDKEQPPRRFAYLKSAILSSGGTEEMNHLKLTSTIAALALGTVLILTTAPKASADERGRCQQRVERAEEHYRHEVHEHGKHSRQAENARAKMNATWDRCWNEAHAWYDPQRHEWRTERDWDRSYDWDRDRNRDHDRDDR